MAILLATHQYLTALKCLALNDLRPMNTLSQLLDTYRNAAAPDGHPKLLHLWPVKLLQAGRTDGDYTGVAVMREAASFNR